VNDLFLISYVLVILYVWFYTEAIPEWFELFKINIFKYNEYQIQKQSMPNLSYCDYLLFKHNCFFVRLITCQICLTTWINIISVIIYPEYKYFLGFNIIFCWLMLPFISKKISEFHE
jgi:hypothetical protein